MMTKKIYSTLFLVVIMCGTMPSKAASPLDNLEQTYETTKAIASQAIERFAKKYVHELISKRITSMLTGKSKDIPTEAETTSTAEVQKQDRTQERLQAISNTFASLREETASSSKETQALIDQLKQLKTALAQDSETPPQHAAADETRSA